MQGMRLCDCVQEIARGTTFRLYFRLILCFFFRRLQKLLGLGMAMAEHVCLAISHLECSCLSALGPEGDFFIFSYASCVLIPG